MKSAHNKSFWTEYELGKSAAVLHEDTKTGVCIVGAGIAGLSTAYLLSKQNIPVTVIDSGRIGLGETSRTTAHLSNAIDDRYFVIEDIHGQDGAMLAAESHSRAIDMIETICGSEQIDCDFQRVNGYLFLKEGDQGEILEREYESARKAGLAVQLTDSVEKGAKISGRVLQFPSQAQFHPLRYLNGLARSIVNLGGHLYEGVKAREISGGTRAEIKTDSGFVIFADAVVVATNSPVMNVVALHTKQAPYRTYVVGIRIPKGSIDPALYWSTGDPYFYARVAQLKDALFDLLIVGGEDHKTGQEDVSAETRFERLIDFAVLNFQCSRDVEYTWSGQVLETIDGLAHIGRNPMDHDNVYVATGDSGMGMTHGTIAGMLISDMILGKNNPWKTLYDPSRLSLKAWKDFAAENINVAAQYADWMKGEDPEAIARMSNESGIVTKRGGSHIAVYKDDLGRIFEQSAVCTHLKCIVRWNNEAKSWDCPCHGSRFDPYGRVINGPAIKGLRKE